jgi:hypothetical protein
MSLEELLRHPALWRAREPAGAAAGGGLPTGHAALDRCLPGGGWPRHGLVELLADRAGIGELSLLLPALARLCGVEGEEVRHAARLPRGAPPEAVTGSGWLAWISPPYSPYAPALAAGGIDVARVLVVRAAPAEWAMEQALRSGACSAVLGWAACRDRRSLRRLQLAAEQSGALAVLFRALDATREPSPAVLRIALAARADDLELRILKSRGGRPVVLRLPRIAADGGAH